MGGTLAVDSRPGEGTRFTVMQKGRRALTPLALDPAHPFPFISNLSLSLAVAVKTPGEGTSRFARVKVPHILPRWLQVPKTLRYVPLEVVIAHHLDQLFPGLEIVESQPFRVTRNADVQRNEEEADDLIEAIQEELRERRFAFPVRLEVAEGMSSWMRNLLAQELEIQESDIFAIEGPLALRDLMALGAVPLPSLRFRPWSPVTPPQLQNTDPEEAADFFAAIAGGDVLVHHPYDSFANSVQRFIEVAAADPAVLALKQTLYRTSADSPNMRALIRAAEERKQVAVTVEIKARFDEAANIEWAERLEKVGAHVCYGVVGLKTHAKIALVVRQERGELRCYVHLATGNYNPDTAKLYTDLGLFTAREDIAGDAVQLFNMLTGYVHKPRFKKLLVAPINMRARFLELIERDRVNFIVGALSGSVQPQDQIEALLAPEPVLIAPGQILVGARVEAWFRTDAIADPRLVVIGLQPGGNLGCQLGRLADQRELRNQIVGRRWPVRLVVLIDFVAEAALGMVEDHGDYIWRGVTNATGHG